MRKRISLSPELYPIESFFNGLKDIEFVKVLEQFSHGRGYNPENLSCVFPEGLAEDEGGSAERFDSIEFWTYAGNQEVRVSFADFLTYVGAAVSEQIQAEPKQEAQLLEILGLIRLKIQQIETAHISYLASNHPA